MVKRSSSGDFGAITQLASYLETKRSTTGRAVSSGANLQGQHARYLAPPPRRGLVDSQSL